MTASINQSFLKYLEGTPIPSSLLLVIVIVIVIAIASLFSGVGLQLWFGVVHIGSWQLHPLVQMFAVSGSLMISRMHIPKL